jgi:hypothetical protein
MRGKAPIHMISARASRQRLVLGQAKVAEKSNEITADRKLIRGGSHADVRHQGVQRIVGGRTSPSRGLCQ